ncbi:TPA: hypothetical protein ACIVB1_001520 [Salmonella enterica subsp. diarizonae serovar 61:l,v:z35]|nr:hypothetical protein [Salmonella enterica subsp. enterica serovar Newport]
MDKNTDDIYALRNFEFLAVTFAKMAAQGRAVNIDTVTGNMDDGHRKWFRERYQHWLTLSCKEQP